MISLFTAHVPNVHGIKAVRGAQYFLSMLVGCLYSSWGLANLVVFYADEAERFLGDNLDAAFQTLPGYDKTEDEIDILTTRCIGVAYTTILVIAGVTVRST